MPVVNYVKFMRGSEAVYNSLATKDSDTLYFVYTNASSETGKLYLGNKLISGSSSIDGNISLSDISDVIISAGVSDGDVLVYNESSHKWESMSISEAISADTMIGATSGEDGAAGLVPAPQAGEQGKFLRGDGTWATVTGSLSPEELESIRNLQSQVTVLIGNDSNKSVATIATEQVASLLIPANADESLDTLAEIAAWIQSHPADAAAMNSSITILQSEVADLNELLNGQSEHPETGLSSRVSALETKVGNFVAVPDKYLNITSAISYLDGSITSINDRLRWHELSNE